MNIDSALQTFFAEAEELLTSMESALLRMDDGEKTPDIINEVFRAAHTIKGSAGLFGLDEIVAFTHKVENVLDLARDEKIEMSSDLLSILLPCRDHIAQLVDNAMHESASDAECIAQGEALIDSLAPWLGAPQKPANVVATTTSSTLDKAIATERDLWHISVRLGPDLLRNGMDPVSIIRFLGTMGTITHIATLTDNLPALAEFDPEQLYLGFEITLESSATQSEIENAFMFVRDDSDIQIIPPRSNISAYIDLIKSLPENTHRLGEILVKSHVISFKDLEQALATQKAQAVAQAQIPLLGEILIADQDVAPELVTAALDKQKKIKSAVLARKIVLFV